MSEPIRAVVEQLVRPYFDSQQLELVDIEFVKEGSNWFLRVFVDKPGGIEIDDCGKISEYLSEKLDEQDPIPQAYFLEVSSPGAERPLKKAKDYFEAVGKFVFITTYEPIDGIKEFEGELVSFDEQTLIIKIKKKKTEIPYSKVAGARLAIVF